MSVSDFVPSLLPGSSLFYVADEPAKSSPKSALGAADPLAPQEIRAKVMVVDDQHLIADTLAEILGKAGFDAIAAYDGFDALEKASRFHPNWVLTDVLMPRMNGVELAIAVRKNHPKSAILLFSGQAGISEILHEGYRQGFEFELIAKPIHPLKLIERLKQD